MSESIPARSVSGALTFETVPDLHKISAVWFKGAGDLTLDLAQVTNTDSAGLALLVEWLRRARDGKRTLRFTNVPTQVQTLIRINGLQDALLNQNA